MFRCLVWREVRVDDERGGAADEIAERFVVLGIPELVIGRVDEITGQPADPVRQRPARMIETDGGDVESTDAQLAFFDELHGRPIWEALVRNREEGRSEDRVHPLGIVRLERRCKDAALPPGCIQRVEERQALQVIPVVVREDDRQVARLGPERCAEPDDA
jgi:hypothetical protein